MPIKLDYEHYTAHSISIQVILRATAGEVDNLVKKLGKRVPVPVSLICTIACIFQ